MLSVFIMGLCTMSLFLAKRAGYIWLLLAIELVSLLDGKFCPLLPCVSLLTIILGQPLHRMSSGSVMQHAARCTLLAKAWWQCHMQLTKRWHVGYHRLQLVSLLRCKSIYGWFYPISTSIAHCPSEAEWQSLMLINSTLRSHVSTLDIPDLIL